MMRGNNLDPEASGSKLPYINGLKLLDVDKSENFRG